MGIWGSAGDYFVPGGASETLF